MPKAVNYNSRSFFHYPAPRPTLKLSAKNQLEKLIKHRAFTNREKQILLALNDVGLLTRHQIQRLFFPSSAFLIGSFFSEFKTLFQGQ